MISDLSMIRAIEISINREFDKSSNQAIKQSSNRKEYMKKTFYTIAALMSSIMMNAQEVQQVQVGDNLEYGVTYSLPKTVAQVTLVTKCRKTEAGQYAQYAEKFLGLDDAVQDDETVYEILSVNIAPGATPDSMRTYHIEFPEKGALPTFYFTPEGSLWSINQKPEIVEQREVDVRGQKGNKRTLKASDVMSPEILKAGSRIKQAELAAQEIFSLRESKKALLKGEADNMPKDGASMQIVLDNLDAQEQALLTLFTGETVETVSTKTIQYVPQAETADELLFRFSPVLGLVDNDDLAGEPYYINVSVLEDNSMIEPNDPKSRKKADKGIAFCVPGKIAVSLRTLNGVVAEATFQAAQFGHVERLPQAQFTDKKKQVAASFEPTTGSVRMVEVN